VRGTWKVSRHFHVQHMRMRLASEHVDMMSCKRKLLWFIQSSLGKFVLVHPV
jgi:hypothetical protein